MNNLTLVIPAKYEVSTLPIVLKELEKYKVRKTIVIPEYDKQTQEAIKDFDLAISLNKNEIKGLVVCMAWLMRTEKRGL